MTGFVTTLLKAGNATILVPNQRKYRFYLISHTLFTTFTLLQFSGIGISLQKPLAKFYGKVNCKTTCW